MKIHGEIVEGKFIERLNRFTAKVLLEGQEHLAHVPTSGRLKELLLPRADILLRKCPENPNRKTSLDLLQVKSQQGIWVSLDSILPNFFVEQLLKENHLDDFQHLQRIQREVKYKNSRFDFYIVDQKGQEGFIEVKSVTLVEKGVAKFPDAPSLRGAKHLEELVEAIEEGYQGAVIFLIQRDDATSFEPNVNTDKIFTENLGKAYKKGVKVFAYSCKLSKDKVQLIKKIPVNIKENGK